jgi:hypothetical protein
MIRVDALAGGPERARLVRARELLSFCHSEPPQYGGEESK